MIVNWKINTGFVGGTHRGEWDVEDPIADEELDEMLQEEIQNHIEAYWVRT